MADDQWAVFREMWAIDQYDIGRVTRITEKHVMTARHGTREAHHDVDQVVFVGDQKTARDLVSVLGGLRSRHEAEARQLHDQHKARVDAAVASAKGAPNGG